jgi:autotransporter translocation and assembly factor TamB
MRSSFWRVIFGVLIALAAPIVVVLILAVLILSVPPIGRYALSQALVRGGPRIGVFVKFGRVEGNIMRSITLNDLVFRLGCDSLKAAKLSLTYDPVASILHRSFSASSATAVEPRFFLSSVRPAAGPRGTGRIQYPPIRVAQLHLAGGSVYVDTVERLDSVNLALSLVSEPAQLRVELSDVTAALPRERVSIASLRGNARLTPDSLIVTDFVAMTPASSLRAELRMAFGPNVIAVRIESLSVSLPELSSAVSVGQDTATVSAGRFTPLAGRLRLSGDAGLDKNRPAADVRYKANGLVWQNINLPMINGSLGLKDSVVQITMSGADTALGSAEASGRLDLRRFDFSGSARLTGMRVRRFHSALPEARVDADLEVSGRGFDSVAANVTVRAPDLAIDRLAVAGSYVAAGQRAEIQQLEVSGPIGAVSGHGTWQGRRAQAEVRMDSLDLELLARFGSPPMQGRVSGSLSLAGTAETLDATADLSVSGLRVAGVSAAHGRANFAVAVGQELSGQLRVAVDQGSYGGNAVDSVRLTWAEQQFGLDLWRPGVKVAAEGNARLARDSVGINVAALRITTNRDEFAFTDALQLGLGRDSMNVRFAAEGLAGGDVRAEFAGAAGQRPRIEATASRVDLARLKALLGFGFDLSGTASISVAGNDSFDVVFDVDHLGIPVADVELSRVEGSARVSRTRVDFDHLWLVHLDSGAAPETSVIAGSLEYRTAGGFELGAADLRVRLRDPGVWVVAYLKPFIEVRQGTVFGDLTLKGSLTRPVLEGRARISQARLWVPVIGASFDRVNAELVFDGNRINIEKLTGRSNHGNALVTGFVDIGQHWLVDSLRFHGDFSGTTINPVPEVYGVLGGSLNLDWTAGRPLSLSGTVDVEEALVALDFGRSVGTGGPDTSLVFDVRVRGDRNIWLRNQLMDMEFAADLTVRKTTADVLYSGQLTSRQGSIYYLDHTLRVDSGSVRFDNISTLNPEFYVTAGMPIRTESGEQGIRDTITATLTGTLEKPSLVFSAGRLGWDENEIISYLTLNVVPEQSQPSNQAAVTTKLPSRLLSYFETQASKRARGFVNLDYLEIESGLLDTSKQARVTVGKYVGRNLYVSYTQNLKGEMIPSFRVEYYINRKNEIIAEGTAADIPGEEYRYGIRYQFRLRY